jgi:hypothetical protein
VSTEQNLALGLAVQRVPLVARLVDVLLDRDAVELPLEPALRPNPRLRPRDALRAVLVAGQLAKLAQLVDGAAGLERHGGELITCARGGARRRK